MEFHIYKDRDQKYRWRLLGANNKTIADSGEGYNNKTDCQNGINLVKGSSTAKVIDKTM